MGGMEGRRKVRRGRLINFKWVLPSACHRKAGAPHLSSDRFEAHLSMMLMSNAGSLFILLNDLRYSRYVNLDLVVKTPPCSFGDVWGWRGRVGIELGGSKNIECYFKLRNFLPTSTLPR